MRLANATQQPSTDVANSAECCQGRLQTIARAHDILINDKRPDTPLSALIQSQVWPYAGNSVDRLSLSGAPMSLGASVAHALGLVLHELASNAAKYGALSA